jgi:hypothetical protein
MKGNKKIWIGFAVLCIVLSLIVSSAILNSSTGGSIEIMSFGSNSSSRMKASFLYFDGAKQKEINLKAGEEVTINLLSKITEGKLVIEIVDDDGNVVKQYENTIDQKEKIKSSQAEKYRILVKGEKAKGSYEITWHK